jgi:hypothetical protein
MGHVLTGVGVDELVHQTIDRATDRRDQMQGLGAIGIGFQGLLHRLHLPGNAPDAIEQIILVFVNVRHTYTPYPYMARIVSGIAQGGKDLFKVFLVA